MWRKIECLAPRLRHIVRENAMLLFKELLHGVYRSPQSKTYYTVYSAFDTLFPSCIMNSCYNLSSLDHIPACTA